MKPKSSLRFAASVLIAPIFCAFSAHAADAIWNGGLGNWDTTATNWTGVTGTPWDSTNGANNKAIFGGTAGTVSLTSGVSANALQFDSTGYLISGASTLTLAGTTPTITTGNGVTATISSTVTGSAAVGTTGLFKDGAGTLTLSGTKSYTGNTVLNAGVLDLIGTGTNTTTYSGSGTLRISSNATIQNWNTGATMGADFTGVLDIKTGNTPTSDCLRIFSTNTHLVNNRGDLNVGSTAAVYINNSTVQFDTLTGEGIIGNTAGTGNAAVLRIGANNGSDTFTGFINSAAGSIELVKIGTGAQTLSGASSYSGTTKVNEGTLIAGTNALSNANGAFGKATSQIALGNTSGAVDASILTGGAFNIGRIITLTSGNTGVMTIGGSTDDASIYSGNILLGTGTNPAKNVSLVALSDGSVDFQGVINENSSTTTVGNVTIGDATHTGTVKLSQVANLYGGSTTITNGATLEVAKLADGLANSSIGNSANTADQLVLNGGTLKFTGTTGNGSTNRLFTIGTNGATMDASSSNNTALTFTNTGSLATTAGASNRTLTLTGSTSAGTLNSIASSIVDPTGGGKTNVTKSGGNTWVLSGNNSYTGGTTVTGGTLNITGNSSAVTGTVTVSAGSLYVNGQLGGNVTVADGATIGGIGTIGTLALNGNSILDLTSLTSAIDLTATSINFASIGFGVDNLRLNGANIDWSTVADGTYTLLNGTLDSTSLGNFGVANAYDIDGANGSRTAYFQQGSLQLVVVPEPTAAALLGSLGMLALLRRRRA